MKHLTLPRGFTLIEMLLALTLTAVLLTIVSVTIGGVLRDSQRLEAMRAEPLWLESVVQIIRRDLRQTEAYQEKAGVLILHSHAGDTEIKGALSHDPARIEYELIKHDDTRWLVRRIMPLQGTNPNTQQVELLCGGIEDMSLMVWDASEQANTNQDRTELPPEQTDDEFEPVPDQLMLTLTYNVVENTRPDSLVRNQQEPKAQSAERLLVIR